MECCCCLNSGPMSERFDPQWCLIFSVLLQVKLSNDAALAVQNPEEPHNSIHPPSVSGTAHYVKS